MSNSAEYIWFDPGSVLPHVGRSGPYRAVVIVEAAVAQDWQAAVSEWLIRSGCLYMMAWGRCCSAWDDSVDLANIESHLPAAMPDSRFVLTTWHESDTLSEVFRFAKHHALHPAVQLDRTVIVHVSPGERKHLLLKEFADA